MPLIWYSIFKPVFEKYLTVLLYGPRSQGKSLHQAKIARKIFLYLDLMYASHQELPQAIVCSNQLFSEKFQEPYIKEREIKQGKKTIKYSKRLYYWESILQLRYCPRENCWKSTPKPDGSIDQHVLHDAYIIFDDIATIIPADGWADLPKWFRKLFAQAGHNDVHCIANIQDPVSCDINFRRYVDVAFKFKKLLGNRRPSSSKPKVKTVWGIYMTWKISAEELWKNGDKTDMEIKLQKEEMKTNEKAKMLFKDQWIPSVGLILRKYTEIYNTLQNVPEYMPNSFEHIESKCVNPDCSYIHVKHRPI